MTPETPSQVRRRLRREAVAAFAKEMPGGPPLPWKPRMSKRMREAKHEARREALQRQMRNMRERGGP